jgi:hypothetical protein
MSTMPIGLKYINKNKNKNIQNRQEYDQVLSINKKKI